jgi:hypothetical protein
MAEISTLFPQLEHLIVGKKPMSIVAILVQIKRSGTIEVARGANALSSSGEIRPLIGELC